MGGRQAISPKTRFEIFKRDNFACQYCGATPPGVLLHIDHVVAIKNGGGNETDNLVTSCQRCNQGKAARPLDCVPQSLKEKAKEVSEREEQLRGYHAILKAKRDRIEIEMWDVAEALCGEPLKKFNRRSLQSIKLFLERLPFHDVLDAADTACARFDSEYRNFRYFCGICWKKIREQDGAVGA